LSHWAQIAKAGEGKPNVWIEAGDSKFGEKTIRKLATFTGVNLNIFF
jgi:hypothetical protein